MRRNTDALPLIVEQLERVQADTGALPDMRGDTAEMRAATAQLAELAVPLQRLGRFRGRRAPQGNGAGL